MEGDDPELLHNTSQDYELKPSLDATYGAGLRYVAKPDLIDGEVNALPDGIWAYTFYRTITTGTAQEATIFLGSNDAIKVHLNGQLIHDNYIGRQAEPNQDKIKLPLIEGVNHLTIKIVNIGSAGGIYFRGMRETLSPELVAAFNAPADQRDDAQKKLILNQFITESKTLRDSYKQVQVLNVEHKQITDSIPITPIMQDLPPAQRRFTHIQNRGSYLDPGDPVNPATPTAFNPWRDKWPVNRLGLAQWLVDDTNPLTARVLVNRYWEQFFGIGLVRTSEDFGMQGELPSHPELLDWLAVNFMENGWSMKELCRVIVNSATYKQEATVTPDVLATDRNNRLFARGPRFRLEAEMVRDQALAVSGLLSEKMHGPSVMPYQPDGVWQVVYNGEDWKQSMEEDRYRRGLYTFWRRTAPYPSMIAFDAPSREVCELRRIRTNTPLQALVTLNDPVYIEAAQALGRRIMRYAGNDIDAGLVYGFQLALSRPPEADELATLKSLYEDCLATYAGHSEEAIKIATKPLGPLPPAMEPAQAAAWTMVSNTLLNLDEIITKI